MTAKTDFLIGDVRVAPGTRMTIDLPMARLYTHNEITMPVHVVHGRRPGPVMFVCAAVHGDEINGVEIIRRLLKVKVLNQIKGTLLAIPIVNPFGFIQRSRYLPDRRDLNRSFPGSAKGSLAGRSAHLFMTEIAALCDFGIDLHTGSNFRTNLPQIRACLHDEETVALAKAFGAPVIVPSELRDGSLRGEISGLGKPVLVYEAGEALYFNEAAIRTGIRGIINVMRHAQMLPRRSKDRQHNPIVTQKSSWVRASMSGTFSSKAKLGTLIKKDALLGILSDPLGDGQEKVFAPFTGIVIGQLNLPLAHEGDALIHLARVADSGDAENKLDVFTSSLTEDDYYMEH